MLVRTQTTTVVFHPVSLVICDMLIHSWLGWYGLSGDSEVAIGADLADVLCFIDPLHFFLPVGSFVIVLGVSTLYNCLDLARLLVYLPVLRFDLDTSRDSVGLLLSRLRKLKIKSYFAAMERNDWHFFSLLDQFLRKRRILLHFKLLRKRRIWLYFN